MAKKLVPIHSAKKAVRDFNEKMAEFKLLDQRMQEHKLMKDSKPIEVPQPSFDSHLRSMGLPATHSVKMAIAKKLGMNDYIGSREQDDELMMSHQGMMQNQSMQEQTTHDRQNADRELSIKEKPST